MTPLVSILIPAYNAEAWIGDTLRSAIAQTWPHKEIVVVDDGSKDATRNAAAAFVSQGVRVVSQSNQGASAARNHALSLARGDYIQWLDSDDLLSPDKVSRQIEMLDRARGPRTLLSAGWGAFMHRPAKARFTPSPLWADLPPVEWMIRKWEGNHHMQTATWLVSRELTMAAGAWDTRLLGDDDGEYFARVIKASNGIVFSPRGRVYYRVTGATRLSYIGRSGKKAEAQFLGMKLQIEYLRSLCDDDRARRACVNYLQTWLHHFHPHRPDIIADAHQIAAKLGGKLEMPRLPWKYAWIGKLFGWDTGRRVQLFYNERKSAWRAGWDKSLSRFETDGGRHHSIMDSNGKL